MSSQALRLRTSLIERGQVKPSWTEVDKLSSWLHYRGLRKLEGAMAILSVPFTSIYLVEHWAGGVIANVGGSYVAGTYVPASIVQAFTAAATSLSAIATSPVTAVGAVAVAAVGGYCYFFGVPAPVSEALVIAGFAEPAKGGLAVALSELAGVLVFLGAAGLVSFNVFRRVNQARKARSGRISPAEAEAMSRSLFGDDFWKDYGKAVWSGVGDVFTQVQHSANNATLAVQAAARSALEKSSQAGERSLTRLERLATRVRGLLVRARLQS